MGRLRLHQAGDRPVPLIGTVGKLHRAARHLIQHRTGHGADEVAADHKQHEDEHQQRVETISPPVYLPPFQERSQGDPIEIPVANHATLGEQLERLLHPTAHVQAAAKDQGQQQRSEQGPVEGPGVADLLGRRCADHSGKQAARSPLREYFTGELDPSDANHTCGGDKTPADQSDSYYDVQATHRRPADCVVEKLYRVHAPAPASRPTCQIVTAGKLHLTVGRAARSAKRFLLVRASASLQPGAARLSLPAAS